MLKSASLSLAGKTYEVKQRPIKANREWRKKFDAPIGKLMSAVRAVKALSDKEFDTPGDMMKVVGITLIQHVDEIVQVLLDSVDLITEAVFAYSPALQADQAYIEEHGYDEEMVRAFLEVVQLAYPFSSVVKSVLAIGSKVDGMSPSSPAPSGDSGKTT